MCHLLIYFNIVIWLSLFLIWLLILGLFVDCGVFNEVSCWFSALLEFFLGFSFFYFIQLLV